MNWDIVNDISERFKSCVTREKLWDSVHASLMDICLKDLCYLSDPPYGLAEKDKPFWCSFSSTDKVKHNVTRFQSTEIVAIVRELSILSYLDVSMTPILISSRSPNLLQRIRQHLDQDFTAEYYLVPVHGARSQNGYFLFSLSDQTSIERARILNFVQFIFQDVHLKLTKLELAKRIPIKAITSRENDVLKCVINGQTNNEIARTLKISPFTVSGYIRNLYLKLNCSDKTSAALKAIAYNLV